MADNKKDNSELPQVDQALKNANKDKKAASDKEEKNGALFYILTILAALLIVALIIGGALFFAIKNNINGIADSMGSSIEKIPVLNLALPAKPEPEDEKNMTDEQVRQKYTQLRSEKADLESKVTELTKQVNDLNKQLSAKDTNSSLLQKQKDTAEQAQQKQAEDYTKLKKDFDELTAVIAKGDTTEFKKYFEKTDPTKAAELYAQILQNQKMSDEVKKYVSIYETMDASAVASIMEKLGTSKMTLIIDIMKNLKKDSSSEILAAMTPDFAAKVSEQLAKVYNVGTAKTSN